MRGWEGSTTAGEEGVWAEVPNSSPSIQAPAARFWWAFVLEDAMSLSRRGEPTRRGGMGGSSGRVGSVRRVLRDEVRRGKGGGVGMAGVERTCGDDMDALVVVSRVDMRACGAWGPLCTLGRWYESGDVASGYVVEERGALRCCISNDRGHKQGDSRLPFSAVGRFRNRSQSPDLIFLILSRRSHTSIGCTGSDLANTRRPPPALFCFALLCFALLCFAFALLPVASCFRPLSPPPALFQLLSVLCLRTPRSAISPPPIHFTPPRV